MAEVFKAKAFGVEGFERFLAIKRILPDMAEDDEFIQMFIDEAKIAVQLTHANICQILELGKIEDSHFIAMEYVWGKDLLQIIQRYRKQQQIMPLPLACFAVLKVSEGLDYAHRKCDPQGRPLGIIHRDISPQNVLVSYDGEVKLIDFGIAQARFRSAKTQAGVLKGKLSYMSPEQARGLPLDRRSDIFSLGILLYEMVTGRRLFHSDSELMTLEMVRSAEITAPSKINPALPPALDAVVLKALARLPDDRYQWANEMQEELVALLMSYEPVFTGADLATAMRSLFPEEMERERQMMEEYRRITRAQPEGDSFEDSTDRGADDYSTGDYLEGPHRPSALMEALRDAPSGTDEPSDGGGRSDERSSIEGAETLPGPNGASSSANGSGGVANGLLGALFDGPTEDRTESLGAGNGVRGGSGRLGSTASSGGTPAGLERASSNGVNGAPLRSKSFTAVAQTVAAAPPSSVSLSAAQHEAADFDDDPTEIHDEEFDVGGAGQEARLTESLGAPAYSPQARPSSLGDEAAVSGRWNGSSSGRAGTPAPVPSLASAVAQLSYAQQQLQGSFDPPLQNGYAANVDGAGLSLGFQQAHPDGSRGYRAYVVPSGRRRWGPGRQIALIAGVALALLVAVGLVAHFTKRSVGSAFLVVTVNPPREAAVFLDGQRVGRLAAGTGALTMKGIHPGVHKLVLKSSGAHDYVQEVSLSPSEVGVVAATLRATDEPGRLRLTVSPAEAEIFLDGAQVVPEADGSLMIRSSVPHELRVSAPGHVDETTQVTVAAGAELRRTIELHPIRLRIEVESSPPGAAVAVDSSPCGNAPVVVENLDPSKPHRVTVSKPGFPMFSKYLPPQRDHVEVVRINAKLDAPASGTGPKAAEVGRSRVDEATPSASVGYLVAETQPPAKIFIDGRDSGRRTPLTSKNRLPLRPGHHVVTFVVGTNRYGYEVNVVAGQEVKLVRKLAER
jgi:serine/threonine protein kinase